MIVLNGSHTIKMERGEMIIKDHNGQEIIMDRNGIHLSNRESCIFIKTSVGSGSINIQTSFRISSPSQSEEYSGSTSPESRNDEVSLWQGREHTNGLNYRIGSNNMMWHLNQQGSLSDLLSNHLHFSRLSEPLKIKQLTKAQINQLPVNLYNGKAKKLRMAREKKDGIKSKECCEPSSNDSCAICIFDYTIGDLLKTLPCQHKFHKKCVDKWLKLKSTCPICKYDLLD